MKIIVYLEDVRKTDKTVITDYINNVSIEKTTKMALNSDEDSITNNFIKFLIFLVNLIPFLVVLRIVCY